MREVYINNEDNHNKFWEYAIEGSEVTIKYGRVGLEPTVITKEFSNSSEAFNYVNKKLSGKIKKGYVKSCDENLEKEVKISKSLGTQNKINRMLWVDLDDKSLIEIDNYDVNRYVYVEVINSWNKNITRLLLSRNSTFVLDGINESGSYIHFIDKTEVGYSGFATAIREMLVDMFNQISEVVKSIKFAAVGVRNLLDDDSEVDHSVVFERFNSSGFSNQVISKFASMGNRTLSL